MDATNELEQERIWIEAAKQGDPRAFNRLVLKWEQRVFNTALRMLHNRDDAAETTQEVFLAAYRNIGRFKQEARFSTWLYRIAINRSISRLRKRPTADQSLPESGENPGIEARIAIDGSQEQALYHAEKQQLIRRSLSALGEDQRAVVELKFFQEMTFEEIAAVVDAPVSTVKSRFYTALDILKGRLSPVLEACHETNL